MAKEYTLEKPKNDLATAITVPRVTDEAPRVVELTEHEQRAFRLYITAKRSLARHKTTVLATLEKHGKLAYLDSTLTPKQAKTYSYPAELQAEVDAVDEKKKAARDSGAADTNYGAISIDFADKKAKAKAKVKTKTVKGGKA